MRSSLSAVVLAAGVGSRMKHSTTKQKILINGKSIVLRAVEAFEKSAAVDEIVIVAHPDEIEYVKELVSGKEKVAKVVVGGTSRVESARLGFFAISDGAKFVAIHDAARCLVTPEMIEKVFADAQRYGAATASTAVTDTVKCVNADGFIEATLKRDTLRLMQTPQIFKCEDYAKAISSSESYGEEITDDNMLLEKIGVRVFCTETGKENMKITVHEDLDYASFLLKKEKTDV